MAEVRADIDKCKEIYVDNDKCQYVWIDGCRIGFEKYAKRTWLTAVNGNTYYINLSSLSEVVYAGIRFRGYTYSPPSTYAYTSFSSSVNLGVSTGGWVGGNVTGPAPPGGTTIVGRQGRIAGVVTSGNPSFVAGQVKDGYATFAYLGHGQTHTFSLVNGSSRTLNLQGQRARAEYSSDAMRFYGAVRTRYRRDYSPQYSGPVNITTNSVWSTAYSVYLSQGVIKPSSIESSWPSVFYADSNIEGGDDNYYFFLPGITNTNNSMYFTVGDYGRIDYEIIYLYYE